MNIATAKTFSVSLIAATLVIAASAAQADPPTATVLNLTPESGRVFVQPSVPIKLGDLNTATPDGALILYRRIQSAARAVCASSSPWVPGSEWARKSCYEATVNHAVAQLNHPLVTALHRNLTKTLSTYGFH